MRLLIITAVEAEAEAVGPMDDAPVLIGGIGRTNAAATTTHAILRKGPFDAVLNTGVAGALPGGDLAIGDAIVASSCVYVEEGLITDRGFADLSSIGLALGDFPGNAVPVDESLLDVLGDAFRLGPIATVATCSGTDEAAEVVVRRTEALAEAMEGAAVVHAARRLGIPAIELRTISNMTGHRATQQWDLSRGLEALGEAVRRAVGLIRSSRLYD
jgi:futalosine hydrolase